LFFEPVVSIEIETLLKANLFCLFIANGLVQKSVFISQELKLSCQVVYLYVVLTLGIFYGQLNFSLPLLPVFHAEALPLVLCLGKCH
jgi:hypothetical protein